MEESFILKLEAFIDNNYSKEKLITASTNEEINRIAYGRWAGNSLLDMFIDEYGGVPACYTGRLLRKPLEVIEEFREKMERMALYSEFTIDIFDNALKFCNEVEKIFSKGDE